VLLRLNSVLALLQLLYLFQLRANHKILLGSVVLNTENIWLAANLAIFHVRLRAPGGLVDRRHVPLTTTGALKACFHSGFYFQFLTVACQWKIGDPYNVRS